MQIKHSTTQEIAATKKITGYDLKAQEAKKKNLEESIIRTQPVNLILEQKN